MTHERANDEERQSRRVSDVGAQSLQSLHSAISANEEVNQKTESQY